MSNPEPQPTVPPPRPPFQFRLRTLLLLFVVLASSLAVFGAWGIVVFGLVVGLAIYIQKTDALPSLAYFAIVVLCLACLIALVVPASKSVRDAARRAHCASQVQQIARALQAYYQANGCFPPAYIADKNGKPMHSWRLLILPYLGYDDLYKAYDFSQPWDGPKNKRISATLPTVYACPCDPNARAAGAAQTSYVAVVGPSAAWVGEKPRIAPVDFPGGTSNTIMVVEVANSGIDWAEPRDLSPDTLGMVKDKSSAMVPSSKHDRRANFFFGNQEFFFTYEKFFFIYDYGVNVAMADGSVQHLWSSDRSNEDLREVLQIGAYTKEEIGSHEDYYGEEWRPNWPNIAALAVWLASVGALLVGAVRGRKARLVQPPAA
jgi:prepilin-type processing-associated H-X9-DG protein